MGQTLDHPGDRPARASFPGRCAALAAVAGLSLTACGPGGRALPEEFELANIKPSNVIPKSSPRQFVATFERFCLKMSEGRDAALRAADYVPTGRQPRNGLRSYAVDDRRPFVMIGATDGQDACAVSASSRTGQTEEVRSMVARRFPGALAVDPSRVQPNGEDAWSIGNGAILATWRRGHPASPATYTLALFPGEGGAP